MGWRKSHAFSHPEWLFELKYDGFRALARVSAGRCQLISRNGRGGGDFNRGSVEREIARARGMSQSQQASRGLASSDPEPLWLSTGTLVKQSFETSALSAIEKGSGQF